MTEIVSNTPLILVLGDPPPDCDNIDRFIPDGIICLMEGTRIGQLAFECAMRRGMFAVGLGCERPEDEAYMREFLEVWISKCNHIVILTHEKSDIWEFVRKYSADLGKSASFWRTEASGFSMFFTG